MTSKEHERPMGLGMRRVVKTLFLSLLFFTWVVGRPSPATVTLVIIFGHEVAATLREDGVKKVMM